MPTAFMQALRPVDDVPGEATSAALDLARIKSCDIPPLGVIEEHEILRYYFRLTEGMLVVDAWRNSEGQWYRRINTWISDPVELQEMLGDADPAFRRAPQQAQVSATSPFLPPAPFNPPSESADRD